MEQVNILEGYHERALSFIHDKVASEVKPDRSFGNSRSYTLPRDVHMSTVFEVMREGAKGAGISEWSVSQGTLEQVFVRVAAETAATG